MTGIDDNIYLRIDDSRLAANVTSDATSPTVTARYGNAACTNLLTGGGHFPMLGVAYVTDT